jgi:transcriptional regulator with XRE-family HTH domain
MMNKIDKRARSTLFRSRLAEAMAMRRISQSALARAIGVDRSTISQLLAGVGARLPNAQVVGECARSLGISADWLLGLTDRPETAADILSNSLSLTDAQGEPVTARVSIIDADGHPVAYSGDATYADPQSGRHYFYVEDSAEFTLPAGRYTVLAARGPMSQVAETEVRVRDGQGAEAELAISEIWDAAAAGYVSADHHVHLNGDGHHRADHEDALRLLAGESLDQLAPMSWNRWERRIDRGILGQETTRDGHTVQQGQEVRSHFHGHIGLLNVQTPFAPWFFGPNNPTLGDPDRTNGEVFEFADRHGAFATYVHPIGSDRDPFTHLGELKACLRPGGELVLETLVVEGDATTILTPADRYAGMRNVWFLPSPAAVIGWLKRMGFVDPELIDVTVTTAEEQHRTEWFGDRQSLIDFLDPDDPSRTREGLPAPRRAIITARCP